MGAGGRPRASSSFIREAVVVQKPGGPGEPREAALILHVLARGSDNGNQDKRPWIQEDLAGLQSVRKQL